MTCGQWSEKNWDALILAIQTGDCILMLGPDASFEEADGRFQPSMEILAKRLAESPEIINEIGEWGIEPSNLSQVSMCFSMKTGRTDLLATVRSFYKERREITSTFYKNLTALPFYLIITSTPDRMFCNALKDTHKEPIIERYNFKGKKKDIVQMGTIENPLIFYLYGMIDEPQSLVITENDLLDFLVAVVSDNPALPNNIVSELQSKSKSLLFLGFGFRNWYLRILLHSLEIRSKQSRSFALEQFKQKGSEEFKSTIFFFSESGYRINICNTDLNSFAKELKDRYKEITPISSTKAFIEDAPTVFICHTSEDKAYAASLYEMLKEKGFNPWLDRESIRGGAQWDNCIERTIKKEIDYFVVLQSNALTEKKVGYVNKEINIALDRQREFRSTISFIIPVQIEDCNLLEDFRLFQTIDLRDPANFQELISTIKRDQQVRQR